MLFFIQLLSVVFLALSAEEASIFRKKDVFHPVVAGNGMVASQQSYATCAGLEVLKEGGNAVDAAVTMGFTLAVVLPRAGNLGGGGFMLVYLRKTGQVLAIDYREKAPKAASREMFLDKEGNADPEKSRFSYLAVGVPGSVAGLCLALERYGTISLARALKPAIGLAKKGFPVPRDLRETLLVARKRMQASPAAMAVFFKKDGKPYDLGENLMQKNLGRSLYEIKKHGPDAFYKGAIAKKIVREMRNNGGLITLQDLASYRPIVREPIRGVYRGYEIYSMPPPSSGGVHLVQLLNILEGFPIREIGHNSAATIHLMAEAMKRAYADRSKHLGDSDFVPVPVRGLISKRYAAEIRKQIVPGRASSSKNTLPGNPSLFQESGETTHFSVMDRFGNVVSNTTTLNFSYGTRRMAPGTGILLNNEMDDFSAKAGVPNAYGLIGYTFNAVEPEKRMLSSMSPTIVLKGGRPFLATGSPGGSRIITATLQIIMNVIDHQMNIAEATNAVRIHHQWLPDALYIEKGLNQDTIRLLETMGHKVVVRDAMGSTQSIFRSGKLLFGASDPRRPGALTLGY